MRRSFTKSAVGESAFRYKVRYESEDCPHTSFSYRTEQTGLLRSLLDNQGLLDCGPAVFETLKMHHDGTKWVVELEATG
jgi:hypothetical protein